jgi:hypothetical protein
MLKALVKAYTGESLHEAFKKTLISGKYEKIESFISTYINCLNEWGSKYGYRSFEFPLYLGVDQYEKKIDENYK